MGALCSGHCGLDENESLKNHPQIRENHHVHWPHGKVPREWNRILSDIVDMDPELYGSQMCYGCFAKYKPGHPEEVFIKTFKPDQTQNARDEIAIFKHFNREKHRNVAVPVDSGMCGKYLVLMQEKLSGGDLLTNIWERYSMARHHPLNELYFRCQSLWLCLCTYFRAPQPLRA